MAKLVRIDAAAQTDAPCVRSHDLPKALTRERAPARGGEQHRCTRFARSRRRFTSRLVTHPQVSLEVVERDLTERDESTLPAFAKRGHDAPLQIDVTGSQPDQL